MNKYTAHSTREDQYTFDEKQPIKKKKEPSCLLVFIGYFAIVIVAVTTILILLSPKRSETKNTLDNTLIPDVAIFASYTPTGTPTTTPTKTLTPEPTIDFQASQVALDTEKEQSAKLTQTENEKQLHQEDMKIKQAELDDAINQENASGTKTALIIPEVTESARKTQTQEAQDRASTLTPEAIENYEKLVSIQRNDFFMTVIVWIIITICSLFVIGLAVVLYKSIWNNMITKPQKKDELDDEVSKFEETEKAKARAVEFADQSKQLLGLIEESIDKYGGGEKKILGHRDIEWLGFKQWSALINLLKNHNRVIEKKGGHGVKGFYLTTVTLDQFFEEIASKQFPPPGSFGRGDDEE